jgi:magnesium transporter
MRSRWCAACGSSRRRRTCYDIETFNLWCFLGRNFVVTVRGPHAPGVDHTTEHLVRSTDLLDHGPARLMHHILDATVDAYFPIIDQLDEFVDGLEERVFVHFDQEALRDIFGVKRLVLQLKRHLAPMREVFNMLQNRPSRSSRRMRRSTSATCTTT